MVQISKNQVEGYLNAHLDDFLFLIESNKDALGIDVLYSDAIKEKDLKTAREYLENAEVSKDKFNDVTPEFISNISDFLKIVNTKKGIYKAQLYTDYYSKMNYGSIQEYMKFRVNMSIFDYKMRVFLTAINSEEVKKSSQPKISENNQF